MACQHMEVNYNACCSVVLCRYFELYGHQTRFASVCLHMRADTRTAWAIILLVAVCRLSLVLQAILSQQGAGSIGTLGFM